MNDLRTPVVGERIDVFYESHHVTGIVKKLGWFIDGVPHMAMLDDEGSFGSGIAWVDLSKAQSIRFMEHRR